MKREVRTVVDVATAGELWLPCIKCSGDTVHKLLAEARTEGSLQDGDFDLFWSERHQILQCLGCRRVSFREESSNSEDEIWLGDDRFELAVTEALYPPRNRDYPGLPDAHFLPPLIQGAYNETLSALRGGLGILAGVGIRVIVEAICREKAARGTLHEMIDQLVETKVLREGDAKLLHRLRSMGNESAHDAKPHGRDLLKQAFVAVEHLLINAYLLEIRTRALSGKEDETPWGQSH